MASAHTAHALWVLLCFFGLRWISRHFLPRSFEEAAPCVCAVLLDPPHITSCLLCEQRKHVCVERNHALIIFCICLRSRWGDLWWCAQRELWLQHRYVISIHYSNIYVFSISLSLSMPLTFTSVVFILCAFVFLFFLNLDYSFRLFIENIMLILSVLICNPRE